MKTTLPPEIMDQISDLIETELKDKGIYYNRKGTVFSMAFEDMKHLFIAQENANQVLLDKGVITKKMLADDFEANFG